MWVDDSFKPVFEKLIDRIRNHIGEHDDLLHHGTRENARWLSEKNGRTESENIDRMFVSLFRGIFFSDKDQMEYRKKNSDIYQLFGGFILKADDLHNRPGNRVLKKALKQVITEERDQHGEAFENVLLDWRSDGACTLSIDCNRYILKSTLSPVLSRSGLFGSMVDVYDKRKGHEVLGLGISNLFADYSRSDIADIETFKYKVTLTLRRLIFVSEALRDLTVQQHHDS